MGTGRRLRRRELRSALRTARRLLQANTRGGARVTTGSPVRGQGLWVYGRAGRPCRRCGTRIRPRRQGELARADVLVPALPARALTERSGLDAVDLGAERHELGLDLLVAAVDVLDAGDDARAGRRQRGEDEGRAGSQVGDRHLGAVQGVSAR